MGEFWQRQAMKYKNKIKAVNFDPISEELELNLLKSIINDGKVVCDIGCGNGRTLLNIAKVKRKCKFYGIDITEGMIKSANVAKKSMGLKNVFFECADAASDHLNKIFDIKFDTVLTKRLLINLKGEKKYKAIKNIHKILKDDGVYIMVECFSEPLEKINYIRNKIGLDEIKVKEFNEYLTFGFMENIEKYFCVKNKIDFQSLYYFISRVFNAYLSKGKPIYNASINKLAVRLLELGISPVEGYSPELVYVLKKNKIINLR